MVNDRETMIPMDVLYKTLAQEPNLISVAIAYPLRQARS